MTPLKYVKEKRKQYGLTQVDLSLKSGVGLRFVRELEQGKKSLNNRITNLEQAGLDVNRLKK